MKPSGITLRRVFRSLGPGVTTGTADDDPSGVATYSIAGAQLGTTLLWMAWLTWPLMAAVQMICARIGMVTGIGLTGALRACWRPSCWSTSCWRPMTEKSCVASVARCSRARGDLDHDRHVRCGDRAVRVLAQLNDRGALDVALTPDAYTRMSLRVISPN